MHALLLLTYPDDGLGGGGGGGGGGVGSPASTNPPENRLRAGGRLGQVERSRFREDAPHHEFRESQRRYQIYRDLQSHM